MGCCPDAGRLALAHLGVPLLALVHLEPVRQGLPLARQEPLRLALEQPVQLRQAWPPGVGPG
ncbi:hypothetical protein AUR04nite_20670 [Glutamicibacter uratoxydans]|uniref:Uncharacterized protein n=1 Tax=Glutamicibacter uratoxydans TaxID=43667 RepID=A0A4Y4DSE8_GLUUR|nr:hypothetical protein AUR04nite_20670 [Glutamicibacter uratoxydans]